MPTYDIAGCPVDFPFEAYAVQLVYMEKVVLALEQGSNALLESPTGTGKTLCLLCAALGWRRAQVQRQQAAAAVAPAGSSWADSLAARFGGAGGGATDTSRAPRIIYASRTHSQLQQVVRELRRTVHRPLVCMLGSREQLCCHTDVSKLTGQTQAAACQALTASQSCVYHRKLQDHKRRHGSVAHPQAAVDESVRTVPDIEDFISSAKTDELCPFYLSRELQASSDVLFLPYNYLLDPKTRRALNINLVRAAGLRCRIAMPDCDAGLRCRTAMPDCDGGIAPDGHVEVRSDAFRSPPPPPDRRLLRPLTSSSSTRRTTSSACARTPPPSTSARSS